MTRSSALGDAMNMHESFTFSQPLVPSGRAAPPRSSWLKLMPMRLPAWLKKCAGDDSDAIVLENLSRLSDTELKDRDLSQDIIALDVGRWG
jgi:hypothetical protein